MRLIAAILGFAASVLGVLGTTEVVAAPPSAAVVYSYDVPHHAAPTAYSNPDRGPPAGYDTDIRSAVDLVSRGASARRQFALALGHTTYDGATRLVLVNEAISTANEQPQGDARALTSFARSGVAAKSADEVADIGHAGLRHQFPNTLKGKSQFYDNVDLGGLASRTKGMDGFLQTNGNTRYVLRNPGGVGVDRTTGLQTDVFTVIRRPDGSVVTMFPGTSPKG